MKKSVNTSLISKLVFLLLGSLHFQTIATQDTDAKSVEKNPQAEGQTANPFGGLDIVPHANPSGSEKVGAQIVIPDEPGSAPESEGQGGGGGSEWGEQASDPAIAAQREEQIQKATKFANGAAESANTQGELSGGLDDIVENSSSLLGQDARSLVEALSAETVKAQQSAIENVGTNVSESSYIETMGKFGEALGLSQMGSSSGASQNTNNNQEANTFEVSNSELEAENPLEGMQNEQAKLQDMIDQLVGAQNTKDLQNISLANPEFSEVPKAERGDSYDLESAKERDERNRIENSYLAPKESQESIVAKSPNQADTSKSTLSGIGNLDSDATAQVSSSLRSDTSANSNSNASANTNITIANENKNHIKIGSLAKKDLKKKKALKKRRNGKPNFLRGLSALAPKQVALKKKKPVNPVDMKVAENAIGGRNIASLSPLTRIKSAPIGMTNRGTIQSASAYINRIKQIAKKNPQFAITFLGFILAIVALLFYKKKRAQILRHRASKEVAIEPDEII